MISSWSKLYILIANHFIFAVIQSINFKIVYANVQGTGPPRRLNLFIFLIIVMTMMMIMMFYSSLKLKHLKDTIKTGYENKNQNFLSG